MQPNPYIGPRSFQIGETLYGRDREARELLGLLVAERIVLLYSPSGAGKTSLIQAALIPRLRERDFFVRPVVRVSLAGKGLNRYLRSTLLSLEEEQPDAEQLNETELDGLSLTAYLDRRPPPAAADGEVLLFDQFEELLTADPTDLDAKAAFMRQLGDALANRDRWALIALREDFVAGLDPYLPLIPTRLASTFRLDLLSRDAAREVIRRPAADAGVAFDPAAATQLVDDLSRVLVQRPDGVLDAQRGPSVEPVQLQVICRRLWDGLPDGTAQIGPDEVAALGDVDRALAAYYAAGVRRAAAQSGVRERQIRTWFERQLITSQGIRGAVLQGHDESHGLPTAAVPPLVDSYLVRGERRRGVTWLELAHDRLIEPVRTDNAAWFSANLSPLQRQAALWEEQSRASGLLLREAALAAAEAWAAANPTELAEPERALLEASRAARAAAEREQRQARRIRLLAIGASVLSLLALAALATALLFFTRSEQQRRAATVRAGAASAVANLERDPLLSLLLARDAVRADLAAGDPLVPEAREALQLAVQVSRAQRIIVAYPPNAELRGLQSVAYSSDGTHIAITSNAGDLLLYDAASGAELQRLPGDPTGLNSVAFSLDGLLVAAAANSGAVLVWEAASGAQLLTLDAQQYGARDLAFSPNGDRLVTAGNDDRARIWNVATGAELGVLEGHGSAVNSASYSLDGTLIVTASDDFTARLWDATTGEQIRVLEGHKDGVLDAALSPAGDLIATVGEDLTLRLWDATSGALIDTLRGHATMIDSVSFSPDGRTIATGSSDTTARLWGVEDRRLMLTFAGHFDGVNGVAISPDGAQLATASQDGTLRQWNLGLAPAGGAFFLTYSPDGARLASAGLLGVQLWDPATGGRLLEVETGQFVTALAFSPDGRRVAVGTDGPLLFQFNSADGTGDWKREETLGGVNQLRFSPDGATLATAGSDGVVRLWDVAAEARRTELLLASDDEVAPVFSLTYSPDGALLAAGNEKGAVTVWEAANGVRRLELAITAGQSANGLAFSPDGRLLAAADEEGLVWVWDAGSGALVQRLVARAAVLDLAFAPDGATLASAGRDRAVTLWDTASWAAVARLPHPTDVNTIAFSPDGATLATAADDGIVRLLPLELDALLALADARAVRLPSVAECATFALREGCPSQP